MTTLDARTIAADIMTCNARDTSETDVWAFIGQAYDAREVAPATVAEVLTLIRTAGIDLIWPDGTVNTELDAVRVDNERLTAQTTRLTAELARLREELCLAERRANGLDGDVRTQTKAVRAAVAERNEARAEAAAYRPATRGRYQQFVHGCGNVVGWDETSHGPIGEQGCNACESAPDGTWRPLYVREVPA